MSLQTTERTALFYMGNLGSEVSRLLAARQRKNEEATKTSLSRCLDILIKIMRLEVQGPRQEELSMLRQALLDAATGESISPQDRSDLESYFEPYVKRLLNA